MRTLRLAAPWLASLLLPALAGARIQAYPTRIHPDVRSGRTVIRRVLILTPHIDFAKVSMKGAQGLPAEADQLAEALSALLAKELAARGVEVAGDPLRKPASDEAKYAVADFQSKYNNIRVQMQKKPRRVDEGKITMGDGVAEFTPAKGFDAVAIVRGKAQRATRAKSVAMLLGMGALSGFQGDVAFVDPRSGDVLAWVRFVAMRDPSQKSEERLAKPLRDVLSDVPFPQRPEKK